jgi:hypothetical protein
MMIAKFSKFNPSLRKPSCHNWFLTKFPKSIISQCEFDEERKRMFLILSYKCNGKCPFCIFRKLPKSQVDDQFYADRIKEAFKYYSDDEDVSISITGGEPLLSQGRLSSVLQSLESHKDKIRWIGIGTNGTKPIPDSLMKWDLSQVLFFISRHKIDDGLYNVKTKPLSYYVNKSKENVRIRPMLQCTMEKDGVSSIQGIENYCQWGLDNGINFCAFRELNEYAQGSEDPLILEYLNFYSSHLVQFSDIFKGLEDRKDWTYIGQDIRPYIYHERWMYRGCEVLFRRVNEEYMRKYNKQHMAIGQLPLPQGEGLAQPETGAIG